jgi:hypothetical protein
VTGPPPPGALPEPDPDEPDHVVDEDGLFVMTRSYLLRRGECCGLACRNCPYVGTPWEHPDRAARAAAKGEGAR